MLTYINIYKMEQNINISLITNQVTNNRKKMNIDEDNNDKNQTNIALYDFFSANQIKIREILTKIPYCNNYYDTFLDYDFIDISRIGEKVIENVDLDLKYIVFNYNDEKRIGFRDFLFNLSFRNKNLRSILD